MIPTARELERSLADDLAWVARELRSTIVEVAPVSPLRGHDRPRAAFRLTLADGRRLKLRRLRSPERALELARLVERLRELGLPQMVLLRAEALVVDWLDGAPYADGSGEPDRVEEAGRLLGRIHATPTFDGLALPALRSTTAELAEMADELERLLRAGRLDPDTGKRLAAAARERDPGGAVCGIVHGDFCAENFVIDGDGKLRVVDNEGLELAPLARDLARVWSRWPLPEVAWRRFLAAYRASGGLGVEAGELALWKLRSLVRSAWYRFTYGLPGDEAALAKLRSLLESL